MGGKQDVGTESSTEKEKGQASDAFKRAGFNWGIGRELYTGPFIWIPLEKNEIYQSKTGSPALYTKFSVKEIGYNEQKEIFYLLLWTIKTAFVLLMVIQRKKYMLPMFLLQTLRAKYILV